MANSPAVEVRQAAAAFGSRADNKCLRPAEREQFATLAILFNHVAGEMEFDGATESPLGRTVFDSEGHRNPTWTRTLAAARAWLVPAVVVPE